LKAVRGSAVEKAGLAFAASFCAAGFCANASRFAISHSALPAAAPTAMRAMNLRRSS
jgi:hypothetical protein